MLNSLEIDACCGGGFTEILHQFAKETMTRPPRVQAPAPLYHYTDAQGLRGILDQESIRATDYRQLNDIKELSRGDTIITEELKRLASSTNEHAVRELCLSIQEDRREGTNAVTFNVYVASFSIAADKAVQWQTYGDSGKGYAIGFTSIPFPTGDNSPSHLGSDFAFDFGKCQYDEHSFREKIQHCLETVCRNYTRYVAIYGGDAAKDTYLQCEARRCFFSKSVSLVPFYKADEFSHEQEWRLLLAHDGPSAALKTFTGLRGIISYIDVPLREKKKSMDLHEVIVGPCAEQKIAKDDLRIHGYAHVKVASSQSDFRG